MAIGKRIVTLGPGGRFVIPADLRAQMDVREGEELALHVVGGELRVTTRKAAIRRAQALVKTRLKPGRSLADELIDDRRAEARRE